MREIDGPSATAIFRLVSLTKSTAPSLRVALDHGWGITTGGRIGPVDHDAAIERVGLPRRVTALAVFYEGIALGLGPRAVVDGEMSGVSSPLALSEGA